MKCTSTKQQQVVRDCYLFTSQLEDYLAKTITCLEKEKNKKRQKAYRWPFFWTIIGQRDQRLVQATPYLK